MVRERPLLTITVNSLVDEDELGVNVWQEGMYESDPRGWTFYRYDGTSPRLAAIAALNAASETVIAAIPESIQRRLTVWPPKCECCGQKLPEGIKND
jgi:hypothetical protein